METKPNDDGNGRYRWLVLVSGALAGGVFGLTDWILSMSNEVSAIRARQEIVLRRLDALENQKVPATANRFTASDAADLEARIMTRLESLERRKGERP
jgi:hypothetical protein